MKFILMIISVTLLFGCAAVDDDRLKLAEKYISTRNDLSQEMRDAILEGKTILGMYPDEAVAASGSFFYVIPVKGGSAISCADIQWYFDYLEDQPEKVRMPPDIMWKQRFEPDSRHIALGFRNRTQYGSAKDVSFVVHFVNGKAITIGDGKDHLDESSPNTSRTNGWSLR